LHAYYASDSLELLIENIKKFQTLSVSEIFGIDYDIELFVTANTVQAIKFPELKFRVNIEERKMLVPELITLEQTIEYLKSVVRNEYILDYEQQLANKKQIEKENATKIEINKLIEEVDIDVFIAQLNEFIGQRDSPKYTQLIKEMFLLGHNDISYLREKFGLWHYVENLVMMILFGVEVTFAQI